MTHSLSVTAAARPPAMYRSATLAMVVSSTSMKVGMITAPATNQGLIARRRTAGGARATLLMMRAPSPSWVGGLLLQKGSRLQLPAFSGDVLRDERFLVVDVRGHRQADEQGVLIGLVVVRIEIDPDGQALDDLHEIAGGVLRRQQGEGLTGPHGEAADVTLELAAAAIHVHLAAHLLADAQVRQLRFLEVGIDPDFRERADSHQTLPHGDVVAGVDVTAGHHAIDLAEDVAVAQVQLGLVQIALGLEELGLALFDGRGALNEHGVDEIEVARLDHCFGRPACLPGVRQAARLPDG